MSYFNLYKSYTLLDLPNDPSQLIRDADTVISGISSWRRGSTFHYKLNGDFIAVDTYKNTVNGEVWAARKSTTKVDNTELQKKFEKYHLGTVDGAVDVFKHCEYEKSYIHELVKVEKIALESLEEYTKLESKDHLKNWVCVHLTYNFGPVLKLRHFYQLVSVLHADDAAYIIQLPLRIDSPASVHAKYCSIEKVKFEEGEMVWDMCTASDSGGWIPKSIQNAVICKKIAQDVPSIFKWVQTVE